MFFRHPEHKRPFGDRPPRDPWGGLIIAILGTIFMVGHYGITSHFKKQERIKNFEKEYAVLIDQCKAFPLSERERLALIAREKKIKRQDVIDTYIESQVFDVVIQKRDFGESINQNKPTGQYGKIVLIIDDVGMDVKRSKQVIDLGVPMTLAFLPYAPQTPSLAEDARKKGHELIIHIPMEAMNADVSLGGMGLTTGMSSAEFNARLDEIFNSFDGYAGVNNHMGSKLTQDEGAMRQLMLALKKRGLFFIDSRTISTSVAEDIARLSGVPTDTRDVFLDHVDSAEAVQEALDKAERIAQESGHVIIIGHPKDHTINALRAWLPSLDKKNLKIVKAKNIIK